MDRCTGNDRTEWGVDMPRVVLTEESRQIDRLYRFIEGERQIKKIRQQAIADALGVSHQAVSKMLRERTLKLDQFVQIMNLLGKDITECING